MSERQQLLEQVNTIMHQIREYDYAEIPNEGRPWAFRLRPLLSAKMRKARIMYHTRVVGDRLKVWRLE